MEWVRLDQHEITAYGSHGVQLGEAARVEKVEAFAVYVAQIAASGAVGRHPTRLWQLIAVISGAGWVAGADGVRNPIRSGQAVMWRPGEEHESGSDEGMWAIIVESSARLPRGE